MNVWQMDTAMAREARYERFRSFVAEHGSADVLDLLHAFDADIDLVDDAAQRWSREHITNGVGRVEGTVTHDGPGGAWLASAECGPHHGQTRTFPTEREAAYWVRTGTVVSDKYAERVRATAGPGGADPSWAFLDGRSEELT